VALKKHTVITALLVSAGSLLFSQTAVSLDPYGRSASGANGVVSAARIEASSIGRDILKKGGNAVDAAIATAFALHVTEAEASGIGGGGFMLVKLANMKEAVVLDFREVAPKAAKPDMFKLDAKGEFIDDSHAWGGLAVGVPGEVAGLMYAYDHYASKKLSLKQLLQPAIDLAVTGYPCSPNQSAMIKDFYNYVKRYPAIAAVYLKDGLPYEPGDIMKNPDLAKTFRLIAEHGKDAIYKGDIAKRIVAEIQRTGGVITEADLAEYKVQVRKPVVGTYRGYTVMSIPPASSGGTHLIELLNILENFDLTTPGVGSAQVGHLWAEALKLVFADRSKYMADTAFVKVPLSGLVSKQYAKEIAAQISPSKVMDSVTAGQPGKYESGDTTQISVMDVAGNMVSLTRSLNYGYGSCVMIPGTGFIMNNHMDDFVPTPGSANSIEPGKRPLSSMSPTLVLDPKGRPFMVLGAPGATRIFPAVAQTISNVIDYHMPIQEAVIAPRYFQREFGPLEVEGRIPLTTYNHLVEMGHKIKVHDNDYEKGILIGGGDPRRDAKAAAF
jgi:gamma-glutamyltranspeptidase/glutathione hydrolase